MTSKPLLIGPATVFTNSAQDTIVHDAGVLCEGGRVREVARYEQLAAKAGDADVLDARNKLVLPGLINAHHHLYSTYARAMPIPAGTDLHDFPHILDGIWWRLDRALDLEAVEAGAWPPALDSLRSGTTTIVDHHASPTAIRGSLVALERVCLAAGLRAALCYEITDRNGPEGALLGIEENASFALSHEASARIRGLLGLHASFTVSDATLHSASAAVSADLPIHIHTAEAIADVDRTRDLFGSSILDRLQKAKLLRPGSLLVHGVHLGDDELRRVASAGAWIVHNPESNANNAVGHFDPLRAMALGVRVALGTDGMASNMLRAAKSAYLMLRQARRDPTVGFDLPRRLLFEANVRLARGLFGEPLLGSLVAGAPADLCVVDYDPPTPLDASSFDGHFTFGITEAPVAATVSDGVVRMSGGAFPGIDEAAIRRRTLAAARAVWKRLS